MSMPLLTIIVPTYKRSANLETLLRTLREETATVAADVVVQVSDNCSPDDTPHVVARVGEGWPALRSHRHPTNIGADRNFCHAVDAVQTRWFWIIGDDDLPKRGVVAQVVAQLRASEPALLYMQSEWINPVLNAEQGEPVGDLRVVSLDSQGFARAVHVWVTFISGMVIDKQRLQPALGAHTINRFDGTNLVQLGWVLPLLTSTGPFLLVRDRCMLATTDNSGGYGLLTVFGVNFTRIANDSFGLGHPLSNALIHGNITQYLPGRIWGTRREAQDTEAYLKENPWTALDSQLGSRWLYWMLLVPLGRFPRWLAQPFFQTWRVLNRLRREWQQRFGVTSA
jgi:glycosyltransferase involved in cell wall biosynthesis